MRSLLALTVSVLALSGCVTENSYEGNDKPVVENKINNLAAARNRIALALEYLNTGNNSQAKYNLERAAEFSPNLPEVHYSFAYYYQKVGENKLADKAYQKAIQIDPNDPNTRNNYGVFLCGIDEYDRATEQLLKAIEIPSYIRVAESYENLALCAIEFKDFDSAENYFNSAIKHSSMRASSLIGLSALYYAKSNLHKAQNVLKRYAKSGQVSARAMLLRYLIEQRMGHIEKAETTAATILQTYPASHEAVLIREKRSNQSEFEILRRQYRQAKLDELKLDSPQGTFNAKPKIRIIKKKKAPVAAKAQAKNRQTAARPTQIATNTQTVTNALLAVKNPSPRSQAVPINVKPQAAVIHSATIPDSIDSTASAAVDTAAVLRALSKGATPPTAQQITTTQKNRTQAVVSALALGASADEHTSKTPTTEAATPPVDGVKIVSFGAPTTQPTAPSNTPATSTYTAQKTIESNAPAKVVFYEPKKNAAVFAQQATRYTRQPEVQFSEKVPNNQLPMLNSNIPRLSIPFHVVQGGENLFSISVRYNVKLQQLLQWNGLKESDRVVNGTKIYLNDPNIYYEINPGDTLFSIATERHLLIDQLMRWNKLSPGDDLKPGHRLLLVNPESYAL